MKVVMKSLFDSTKRCHTCLPHEKRKQLVLEDDDGLAQDPTQSDKEPLIPPGVFQMGKTPDVYPEGSPSAPQVRPT